MAISLQNLESAKSSGLLVGDQLIQRITGPTSITILKPPQFCIFYKPPIILFGDDHDSTHGECENCEVKDGCYRVSDDAFFQAFDHVSTEDAPVDFYIETYMKDYPDASKMGELRRTIDVFRRCAAWDASKKQRYRRETCPTQLIRYQYADLRVALPSSDPGAYFEHLLAVFHTNPDYAKNAILTSKNPIIRDLGMPVIDAFDAFGGYDKNRIPDKAFYAEIMHNLIMNAPKKYSRIRKQLEKMPKNFNHNWIETYIFESISKDDHPREFLSSWMVDLYTILRLFKMPKDGPSSALAVLYFGDMHKISIINILKSLDYEVVYQQDSTRVNPAALHDTNSYNRCIEFDKKIDINPLLAKSQEHRLFFLSLKKSNSSRKQIMVKGGHIKRQKKKYHTRKKLKASRRK